MAPGCCRPLAVAGVVRDVVRRHQRSAGVEPISDLGVALASWAKEAVDPGLAGAHHPLHQLDGLVGHHGIELLGRGVGGAAAVLLDDWTGWTSAPVAPGRPWGPPFVHEDLVRVHAGAEGVNAEGGVAQPA